MAQRMNPRQMILGAVGALVGLYAVGTAFTWLDAMLAEHATAFIVMSAAAILGSLAMAVAVPVNHLWRRQPRWAPYALGALSFVGGVCAAVCQWVVRMIQACEAVCTPPDTWGMLPFLAVGGLLAALGPAWVALGLSHDVRPDGTTAGRAWWGVAIVVAILGFCVGMYFWVEMGLYPEQ